MAILPLVIAPDPILSTPSEKVSEITDEIKQFCQDMLETMYANQGIGLAAVQVGVHKKIVVIDIDQKDSKPVSPIVFINPEIIEASEELSSYQEGCLSFPSHYSDVERPARVSVKYLDIDGNEQILKAEGLMATCIQHEIDHTDGIVFVDHISKLKKEMIIKKLQKAKKLGALPVRAEEEETLPTSI